jgi:hypothetical protein
MSRASTSYGRGSKKDVDGRDKPGHDEKAKERVSDYECRNVILTSRR